MTDLTDWLWLLAATHFTPLPPVTTDELTDAPVWPVVGIEAVRARRPRFVQLLAGEKLIADASSQDLEFVCYALEAHGGDGQATLAWLQSNHGYQFSEKKSERMDYYLPRTIIRAFDRLNADTSINIKFGGALPEGASLTPIPRQPAPAPVVSDDIPEPGILRMNSKLEFEPTLKALVYTLTKQVETRIGFDEFYDRVMLAPAGTDRWQPLTDNDMIQLRDTFERTLRFASIPKETMRDALELVASRHKFDSAMTWIDGLTWDGVPRINQFLSAYCGTVDDEYTRAVSEYIWTGLAGRVLDPGCQLDMVVAFQSPQGRMKSTGFQAMVPTDECFTDGLSLHEDDDNFKRLLRGKLLVEVAEMAGLSKADIGLVKRVITRRVEEWIEKFKTQPSRFKRRCMLFASTNEPQFLPLDETGQRRWLPVEVTILDRDRIAADRDQLWAEGAARWSERRATLGVVHGVAWQDAERLAAGKHAKYEQTDVWEVSIERWLSAPGPAGEAAPATRPLALSEVLTGAIGLNTAHQDVRAEKRAARVMRQLGYESQFVRLDGKLGKRWALKGAGAV